MKRICVSSGHAYRDTGAIYDNPNTPFLDMTEFEYVKKMQAFVTSRLGDSGYYPVKEAVDDSGFPYEIDCDSLEPKDYLRETIKAVNKTLDLVGAVEIHLNNVTNTVRHGGIVLHADKSVKGEKLAKFFADRLASWMQPFEALNWSSQGRPFKAGFLYRTYPPAIIIEAGFMSNENDRKKIKQEWQVCAEIILECCEEVVSDYERIYQ